MRTCIKLNNYYLVQLNEVVAMGTTHTGNIQTERVDLIRDEYMVCKDKIYSLGAIDKVWMSYKENQLLLKTLL